MTKIFLRIINCIIFLFISLCSFAQQKVEMADKMRSNGKIYVVVAVGTTILTGLFIYIFFLDKKISRFEKNKE